MVLPPLLSFKDGKTEPCCLERHSQGAAELIQIETFWPLVQHSLLSGTCKKCSLILILHEESSFLVAHSAPQAWRCCWPPTKPFCWRSRPRPRCDSTPLNGGFGHGVHLPTFTFLFAQRGSYHRVIFVPVPASVFICIQRKLFEICKVQQSISLFHHWHLFWPVDIPVL